MNASTVSWQRWLWQRSTLVILLFAFLLLSLVWGGLYYKIRAEQQIEIEQAIKETSNFARAFEEHSLRTIRSADQTVLFLKYQYETDGAIISIPRYINEGRLTNQPFVLLSIAGENGDLLLSSQVPFVPSNLKDREHFFVHQKADTNQLFISKPVLGRSSGKWSIQMTRRINKPDKSFGGVVIVSVDLNYFTNFYRQVHLGDKSSIALVGFDGIVRARQAGEDHTAGQDLTGSALLQQIQTQESGSFIGEGALDPVKRIYSYHVLPDYPLAVVVGIAEEEVLASLHERIIAYYQVVGALTFILLLFICLLLLVIRRQKRTEMYLAAARDELEEKVKERTKQLFTVNGQLTGKNQELLEINTELQKEVHDREAAEGELKVKNVELENAYSELKNAQSQILHQEKMASIGQLAAGIAHEINNPLGFVLSNYETLEEYTKRLIEMIAALKKVAEEAGNQDPERLKQSLQNLSTLMKKKKIDYILTDIEPAFSESLEGLQRVGSIVKALRAFSRSDQSGSWEAYDLNEGIQSSLVVCRNEFKYIAAVDLQLGDIPLIQAVGGQINQVLLNLLLNAAQAITMKEGESIPWGKIVIETYVRDSFVCCSIRDNGSGIPEEIGQDIFNPFFTTKPVGSGTGLGLSISYDIIVNKHHGKISFTSKLNEGTQFLLELPLKQTEQE
ncbi:MAG: ATP-binding protein [Sporomusaceae bacterium]|nr:ATP-binding protein [Sporomusaceae bacterium]